MTRHGQKHEKPQNHFSFNIISFQVKWKHAATYTHHTKLDLGWWSVNWGFSRNWKALWTYVAVLFPYITLTERNNEGTLSVRYSSVLQVISSPKCSLQRQGHNTNWLVEWGSHEVTVQSKPAWQQPDSLLNLGFAAPLARYFPVTSA